ncbi:hypothetical protein QAD02_005959 [Eretmocerus hayati]|uniref:Uncharacterized protein n=1 Tax=Eretmocerus hayati TaxID=131215 RepID=A0ACC2N011_9HYME|nr:hypothetical protein QAD02_005959 [Eretmocerus hayati]
MKLRYKFCLDDDAISALEKDAPVVFHFYTPTTLSYGHGWIISIRLRQKKFLSPQQIFMDICITRGYGVGMDSKRTSFGMKYELSIVDSASLKRIVFSQKGTTSLYSYGTNVFESTGLLPTQSYLRSIDLVNFTFLCEFEFVDIDCEGSIVDLEEVLGYQNGLCTILTRDGAFQVCQGILWTNSQVFAEKYRQAMKENQHNFHDIIVTDIEDDIMQEILRFMYSGTVANIVGSNAIGLYEAAEKYQVEGLKI